MTSETPPNFSQKQFSCVPILLSIFVPGAGQLWNKQIGRGISIFVIVFTALGATVWYGRPSWYILPILLWLWNIWDAIRLPKGAPIGIAAILWLVMAYGIGWQVTEIDPMGLIKNRERASSIVQPMLRPDFIVPRQEINQAYVDIKIPCPPNPPPAENSINDIHVRAFPDCVTINDMVTLTAEGLWENYATEISWQNSIGDIKLLGGDNFNQMLVVNTDESGKLNTIFQVPPSALAATDPNQTYTHRIILTQRRNIQGFVISKNGRYVLQGIYETLALALLATTLGAIVALPISFLAARNLMAGHIITMAIYTIVRGFLNFFRSIESLILAIIFVVIVGLGPFPGMLAITLHTIAALGKLYSEVIEGIDPGPIEAIRATGADWRQVVRYAVIPQIVPSFTALTIYRWDINVRSSTIIGFVGGGGIGFYLYQWIIIGDYSAVSTCFIAIALVVIALDFFSARLRERLI